MAEEGATSDPHAVIRALLDHLPCEVVVVDADLRVVLVAGRDRESGDVDLLVGRPLADADPVLAERVLPGLEQVLATGEAVPEHLEGFRSVTVVPLPAAVPGAIPAAAAWMAWDPPAPWEIELANRRLLLLAEASATLAASLDYEETLARVARLAVPELADSCVVDLVEPGPGTRLRRVAVAHVEPDREAAMLEMHERYPPSEVASAALDAILRRGRPVVFPEIDDALRAASALDDEHRRRLDALDVRSVIVAPLVARARTLGAITFHLTGGARRFREADLSFAGELASRAAQAIENARLYRDRTMVARTLQASLLPPALPLVPGIELAARYVAAGAGTEVGGDFYDVFATDADSWIVMVGDVRGQGVEAATITGLARHAARAAAVGRAAPDAVLRQVNDVLLRAAAEEPAGDDPRFCTMCVGQVQPRPGGARVVVASAGHPPPQLLRADGTVERIPTSGALLGVLDDVDVATVELLVAPGDALVLYTDGVIEAHDAGRWYGPDGLAATLRSVAGAPAEALAAAVERDALAIRPGEPADDMAVLVLRVPPV
jgi:serine phosphatase RsbU (regulator of sigma subunit)